MSVLLTNGQLRKTLASVRSLGNKGVQVHVAETTRFNPSAYSRYSSRSHLCPAPDKDKKKYSEWLAKTLVRHHIKHLFPMDDDSMSAVMEHLHLFPDHAVSLLPPKASYDAAANKATSILYALRSGVHAPITIAPQNIEEIAELSKQLKYPIVIKPRYSSGSRGIRIVETMDELKRQYNEIHKLYPLPLLQECIPSGERYDVCLLYDNIGKLKAFFVQKEIRHFPIERGPSTLQESVNRPDLVNLALSIMKHLPWKGVVEIEFMIDPRDGQPKFMEINPRFWNSLHTSILSGVDFPWLLYRLSCGDAISNEIDYQVGIRCRTLLPGDILHYAANPHRFSLKPSFWLGSRKGGGSDDIISWQDPLPSIGFLLTCLRYLLHPKAWKLIFTR